MIYGKLSESFEHQQFKAMLVSLVLLIRDLKQEFYRRKPKERNSLSHVSKLVRFSFIISKQNCFIS